MSDADWVEENVDPASMIPEAIRVGTTESSGRAIHTWAKQYDPTVSVGVLIRDTVELVVVVDGHTFDMKAGDYLARVERPLEPGVFDFSVMDGATWQIMYGSNAVQEMPVDPYFQQPTPEAAEEAEDEPVL